LAYENSDQVDSAIESFEKAIKLKPDFAAAHYELAVLYVTIDEPQLATEQYEILLRLNPKLADKLQQNMSSASPTP